MNKQTILFFSKKVFSRCKHTAIRLAKNMLPKKNRLLFVFGGRTQYWAGMGSEFYAKEPVFRNTINKCDTIICKLGGNSILTNFQDNKDEHFFNEEPNIIFSIISLQIALFELWKSKGISPDGIMGVSIGEVSGIYAAGGLSLEDTLKAAATIPLITGLVNKEFIVLYIHADLKTTKTLSRLCPVFFAPVYERSESGNLCLCNKVNKETVENFLKSKNISCDVLPGEPIWPYHTKLLLPHEGKLTSLTSTLEARPLEFDYFSCTHGKLIPKNTVIDNKFWFHLQTKPVLTHTTLQAAKTNAYNLLVHIGSQPFLKGQLVQSAGGRAHKVKLLDSMNMGNPESEVFNKTHQQLLQSGIKKKMPVLVNETKKFDEFRDRLNFSDPLIISNPYPYYKLLQKHGAVHYLPMHKGWFVLDNDLIDDVLKDPGAFSSSVHKDFDKMLLGADPPSHTEVRTLLQPLFSQQALVALGAFTAEKSQQLLDGLLEKEDFNFVDEFSLPLAQAAVAKFLKLSNEEAQILSNSLSSAGHVYNLGYLDNLESFFNEHLKRYSDKKEENLAVIFNSLIREEKLSHDGAVSLMKMLWVAGMTTTSMLLSHSAHMLATNPHIASQLRNDEALIYKFIEECLRLKPPELALTRITTKDVEVSNYPIPKGSIIFLALAAANRNEAYFTNPDEIMLDRPAKRHLTFGGGCHYCLGVGMARTEAKYAIKALLERMPNLCLSEEVSYYNSSHFHALDKLIVHNYIIKQS